jgi:outer membrane protein insertion porin family
MKFIFALLIFLVSHHFVLANDSIVISQIKIKNLVDSPEYKSRTKKFQNLKGSYRNFVHLRDTIKILASDGGYNYFDYSVEDLQGVGFVLNLDFQLSPIISNINFISSKKDFDTDQFVDLFSIKQGHFYRPERFNIEIGQLQKKIQDIGYPGNKIIFSLKNKKNYVDIDIKIELGKPLLFKGIKPNSNSLFINTFLKKKFLHLYNLPFHYTEFKRYLDMAQKELVSYGYYLINFEVLPKLSNDRVKVDIKVAHDDLFTFNLKTSDHQRDEYLGVIHDLFRQYKKVLTPGLLKQGFEDHLKKSGVFSSQIEVKTSNVKNKFNDNIFHFEIIFKPSIKTIVQNVTFKGNTLFSDEKLKDFYKEQSFELANHGFLDIEYLNFFREFLRNQYIQQGYLQVKIDEPIIHMFDENKFSKIEFKIKEGSQTIVKSLEVKGVPVELQSDLNKIFKNEEGKFFNPLSFTEDLKNLNNLLKNHGYYFSEVLNQNAESLVKFNDSNSEVEIYIHVYAGKKITVNKLIFLGNTKTKKSVLLKKIKIQPGEIVTPEKLIEIEAAITSTGLFNSVNVSPLRHSSKRSETDLLIKTTERDYGLVEFAPGFRTDLGLKISGSISYLNIAGENKSLTLKTQVNQRLNYQTFDPRRRKERIQLLEHNTSLFFNQSDLFDTSINLGLGSSYQRKRFYSFDADIWRMSSTFSRDLSSNLSASLRYQWETISQFDGTELRDNGSFQIGAITPSLTYDLRNNQINPYKGSFFNLSCEFANPYFLSQDKSDLTINYYKLVSRNRFYVPLKNGTIAISLVGGVQENLATDRYQDSNGDMVTEGYIPNIKVFRLTGMDIVRGFNDEEINRLPDSQDISEVRIEERAYLANLKIEPRYFINDNLVLGTFYDAGRVSVNSLDLGDLRDSVGLTFKILTPVGTLDFDYGIKLLRKKNQDGTLEDPGRFHVSIGFF